MGTMRGTTTLALVLSVLGGGAAQAQQSDERQYAENEITVTATRVAADTFEVPSVVTVIDAEEIENNLVADIKDLIRFEPGVSVPTSPSRFSAALSGTGRDGNSGFNIRGMGGNRVLFQVDGIRVPDGFSFGPNAFGRGDYVDLELLQSVEIVRGPASALYGSDGLAGVVSFITRDPEGFLAEGENFGARVRVSYASVDDSWAENITAAGRLNDQWSALAAYTRRDGHDTENQGENASTATWSTRTVPNPQEFESNSVLGRIVFQPSDAHRFRLTGDYGDRTTLTEPLTGRSATVLDLDGLDESERSRLTLDYTFDNEGGFIDGATVAIYAQTSSLFQYTYEDRTPAVDRTRQTTYDTDVWGFTAQGESLFEGSVQHRFVYGVDYSTTTQSAIRDGTVPTPPAVFPDRPFPETDYERTGVFLVDEITLLDGALTLFPGVRYDSYELSPQDDALYLGTLSGQSDEHISPKFGIVAWPIDTFGVFFNYASGFKAPAPNEVSNFFENLTFGGIGQAYTSIPNPNLTPETSEGFEAGVRGRNWQAIGGSWDWSASAFATFYEDFISQQVVSGSGSTLDPFVYQYINLNEVDITGAEARVRGFWENGVGLDFSVSYADGEQRTPLGRAPLQSIDPRKLVTGLSYDEPDGRWGGQFIVTYSSAKADDEVFENRDASAANDLFTPDAFTILDLTAYWNVTDAATLRVGVFNLTDETYWWWSDARGLPQSSTILDAYTQPGRNFSASISYRF
ncbi:TonB-dependent hemoglobin/transferrin/lactoferrin family receptor [Terricaulis sp.]|uniref:TonB-dependent hemoglobin/transferrin/lactoferrin family receptor n=1 Tax=Terricaulis sp. TaxID=2768686 RepID=UPI002AC3BF37|nr:TonB-dependent hemoglobin/transferrin/lactoferrin family receptor [Terricaulis sp.]MDZ4693082.1 TonB-dependent hemoglobin/transferrin/lactoferrin family receptor [Terricaulis sp.]